MRVDNASRECFSPRNQQINELGLTRSILYTCSHLIFLYFSLIVGTRLKDTLTDNILRK